MNFCPAREEIMGVEEKDTPNQYYQFLDYHTSFFPLNPPSLTIFVLVKLMK